MCGICGFSGEGDTHTLSRMMAAMPYRGPDDSGQWHDGRDLHLGHLRLSIVDLAEGHQPMRTEDESLVVVFNGEIYNHHALRKELEALGYTFRTHHSDTEVLLHGYRQWGRDLVHRLNGMWAFALFDRYSNSLWLSRDRFGKKPLYFSQSDDCLIFASELSSLVEHPRIVRRIDRLSLMKYFTHGYVPAPRTILQDVKKLPAGHNAVFHIRQRTLHLERYWRFEVEPDYSWRSRETELAEALVDRLSTAVGTRLQADVPAGVFLSGGMDSSAIAALATSMAGGQAVRTYSIGFEEPSFDESQYSNQIAAVLKTEHTQQILSVARCIELLDDIYCQLDEPIVDSALVPSYLMCRLARKEVTVALSGDGADELFAGYDLFRALESARRYFRFVPSFLHGAMHGLAGHIPVSHRNMSLEYKLKRFLLGLNYDRRYRNPVWLGPLAPEMLARLFGSPVDVEELYSEAIDSWEVTGPRNDVDRTLQFYVEMYLQNNILTKMDRAGMMNSLEVRSPFLDIGVVDLVRTIPADLKFDGKKTKRILKQALAPILPTNILNRKKMGFSVPFGRWFEQGSLQIDSDVFDGMLDSNVVQTLYDEHANGKANWRSFLWAHYVLEQWANRLGVCTLV